ncbi:MAG: hypothetical protein AAF841_04735 [Pseudomonadota bacterium]
MDNTKIATCCYCGTRAALVLTGTKRHELACSACGAPLHNLKMLPKSRSKAHRDLVKPSGGRPAQGQPASRDERRQKGKKHKKKKGFGRMLMGEIFDVIEDIID